MQPGVLESESSYFKKVLAFFRNHYHDGYLRTADPVSDLNVLRVHLSNAVSLVY